MSLLADGTMAPPIWVLLLLSLSVLPRSCLSEPVHDTLVEGQKQEKVPLLLLLKSGSQDSDRTPVGPTGPPANSGALNFPTDSEEHPRKADSFIAGAPTHAPIPMVYSCLMPSEKAWQRVEVSCKETPSAEQTHKLAEAMMEFTLDLFAQVLQKSTSPNVVLSPLSVALALYHLELGARTKTVQQLQKVLHAESVSCLHHTLNGIRQELGGTALRMASRMYLEKGFPVKQEFLEQSEKFFGAKPAILKGNEKDDLQIINQWVKEATEGKIENFLVELPANTVMLLLNAVYFQGFWKTKFDPSLTKTDVFHLDEKYVVPVVMMKAKKYPLRWFLLEQADALVAQFPFKNNMSFVTVVPSQFEWNASHVLGNLSGAALHQPFMKERPTEVMLPKLHLDHQMDLVSTLGQLGLQELFHDPDLSGISEKNLVVSSVQHRATLELDEAGVEASAATSAVMSRMSLFSVNMNRPFLFFIFDDVTHLPLFVGSVKNPNPSGQKEIKEQRDAPDNKDFLPGQKFFFMKDKLFGPNLKFSPPMEEDDYPEVYNPK
ncbi:alpha-2-antiplasmin isoform X1 [Trichosurus vulpecula]|uniref:alpha-2-antiplasmin isoform X1 n=2 Tax=Trichosurus vulpecula TaxID=9337 RepID=UPI00186B09B7|nr:alpha-2-antiplasmin isoform X1 [Trichosurus vulpecula]